MITRLNSNPDRYRARFAGRVGVIPCVGGRDPAAEERLKTALARGDFTAIRSLRARARRATRLAGSLARNGGCPLLPSQSLFENPNFDKYRQRLDHTKLGYTSATMRSGVMVQAWSVTRYHQALAKRAASHA